MFKYEGSTLFQAALAMRAAYTKLDMYEQELRVLSRTWDRNPDMPAPRDRLRRSIQDLERKETSLNLMCRKLESVIRIYENTEARILDEAERGAEDYFRPGLPAVREFRPLKPGILPPPAPWRRRLPGFIPDAIRPLGPLRPFRPKFVRPRRWMIPILRREVVRRMLEELLRRRFRGGYMVMRLHTMPVKDTLHPVLMQLTVSKLTWTAKPILKNLNMPLSGSYSAGSSSGADRHRRILSLMKHI